MTEILLIRHPETALTGTFCGHSDPPINAAGQTQLAALLRSLEGGRLEMVYASDLQRARTLGEALACAQGIPCKILPALREIYFGDWESLTWAQVEEASPQAAATWIARYPHEPAPRGEAFPAFEERVLSAFDQIVTAPQHRIAVVTHAGVLRTLLTRRFEVGEATAAELTKPYCSLFRRTFPAVTR